jgi:hypothetical protein
MYLREMREKMKKENPKLVMSEFMKMVSMEWTRMSQEEKKRYDRLVQGDRSRYDREFNEYKRNLQLGDNYPASTFGNKFGEDDPDEFDQEDRDYKTGDNPREGILPGKHFKHMLVDDIESMSEMELGYMQAQEYSNLRRQQPRKRRKQPHKKVQKLGDEDDSEVSIGDSDEEKIEFAKKR